MKTSLKTLIALALVLTFSCDDEAQINDDTTVMNEELVDVSSCIFPSGKTGVCLDGPKAVTPGKTYNYLFSVSKLGKVNINEVVNWIVLSGEMEIINIETTLMPEFTFSVATIKFTKDFNGGKIKASSDENKVDSPLASSWSYITIPIGITE